MIDIDITWKIRLTAHGRIKLAALRQQLRAAVARKALRLPRFTPAFAERRKERRRARQFAQASGEANLSYVVFEDIPLETIGQIKNINPPLLRLPVCNLAAIKNGKVRR